MTEHEHYLDTIPENEAKFLKLVFGFAGANNLTSSAYECVHRAIKRDFLTQAHTQWRAGLKKEIEDLDGDDGDGIETASDQWILRADVLALPSLQDTEKETDAR